MRSRFEVCYPSEAAATQRMNGKASATAWIRIEMCVSSFLLTGFILMVTALVDIMRTFLLRGETGGSLKRFTG